MTINAKRYIRILGLSMLALVITLGNTACSHESEISTVVETSVKPSNTQNLQGAPVHNSKLEQQIDALARQSGSTVSVYINFPDKDNTPYLYNDTPLRSASMIKIFILATLYEEEQKGNLTDNHPLTLTSKDKVGGAGSLQGYPTGTVLTVAQVASHMITESDNTATNMLIDLLGMERINQYIQDHGYADTRLQRKMMDVTAVQQGRENYTSAKDLGTIFTKIYQGECVSPVYDKKMVDLLLQQEDMECIPTALPDVKIAHKTGELVGLYHDGGIIYSPHGNYVLCIMTDNQESRSTAIQSMRQIVQLVNSRDN